MLEKWKHAFNQNKFFGDVLTDLSKVFQGICYDLLIAKSNAYSPSFSVLKLVRSSHRRYSLKKVFLKIPQISQENTCDENTYFQEHLQTTAHG